MWVQHYKSLGKVPKTSRGGGCPDIFWGVQSILNNTLFFEKRGGGVKKFTGAIFKLEGRRWSPSHLKVGMGPLAEELLIQNHY